MQGQRRGRGIQIERNGLSRGNEHACVPTCPCAAVCLGGGGGGTEYSAWREGIMTSCKGSKSGRGEGRGL